MIVGKQSRASKIFDAANVIFMIVILDALSVMVRRGWLLQQGAGLYEGRSLFLSARVYSGKL